MNTMKSLLVTAAVAVIGGGVAYAAQPAPTPLYDPAQLPSFKGKVTQYDLTPRGDVDGLILDGATEVHFSPRQSTLLVATVKPGDSVTVHGLKASALPMIEAMSITQDASGQTVIERHDGPDFGPEHHHFGHEGHFWPHWFGGGPAGGPADGQPGPMVAGLGDHPPPPPGDDQQDEGPQLSSSGTVRLQLHGPRGELDGVLLDNGAEIHFPPPVAQQLGDALAVGKAVAVKGPGSQNALGTSIAARSFGTDASTLKPIDMAPPQPGTGSGMAGHWHDSNMRVR